MSAVEADDQAHGEDDAAEIGDDPVDSGLGGPAVDEEADGDEEAEGEEEREAILR